jgi:hypothetical protein
MIITGCKLPQIAENTGLSYANAAIRVHRIQNRMRKTMGLQSRKNQRKVRAV